MPIPLGVLAVAGAGGAAAGGNAYELLESQILSSAQQIVTFSNLNSTYGSTYQHLQVRSTVRFGNVSATASSVNVYFNGDNAGSSYASHWIRGQSSTVASAAQTSQASMFLQNAAPGPLATANIFGALVMDILDPFETTKNKTVRTLFGQDQTQIIYLMSGFRNNTEAIDSISFSVPSPRDFVEGSRFSLYGMRSS